MSEPGQKVPGDTPLLVELLQDHASIFMKSLPESRYKSVVERMFSEDNRCSLDEFREILESRGWKRKGTV